MSQSPISRRQLLKILAAAAGTAVLSSVPTKWKTPVVEVGMLPAHAQTLSGLGAISGTVRLHYFDSPVRGNSPSSPSSIPSPIPVTILGTGFTTNATYDHYANSIAYLPFIFNNVPVGTYTARCTYCGVTQDDPGVIVHALATTPGVDFPFNHCAP